MEPIECRPTLKIMPLPDIAPDRTGRMMDKRSSQLLTGGGGGTVFKQ